MPSTVRSRVFRLALPAAGEMVVATSMFLVNTAFVGRLGARELAAAAAAGLFFGIVQNVFGSFSATKVALLSRAIGAGDLPRARRIVAQTLLVTAVAGLAALALGFAFAGPLARLLGLEPDVARIAERYMRLLFCALPFLFLLVNHKFLLRATGDTKSPLYAALVSLAVVALLDWILVFGNLGAPALGVDGAAVAFLAAGIASFLYLRTFVLRRPEIAVPLSAALLPDPAELSRLLRIGLPTVVEQIANQASYFVFIRMVASLGTVPFAGHEVALTVESVSFMPGFGFALAASILVGQSLGRAKRALARAYAAEATLQASAVMTGIALLFLLFPGPIARLFCDDPAVVAAASLCIRLAVLEQTALGVAMVSTGVLRGAGDTRTPLRAVLLSNWLLRIPLTWLLSLRLGWGLSGVWIATAADWALRAFLLRRAVARGRWLRIEL